ncbi:MAG: hypothetical protein S4CHLAM102_08530 [Chlamydiia bacterium]|nr:hypothetical protein [Chlamydiia bacterium]
MATFYQTGQAEDFSRDQYEEVTHSAAVKFFVQIKEIYTSSFFFHLGFVAMLCLQLMSLCVLIGVLPRSGWIALNIATFFVTFFSYLILFYYLQSKKPEQFRAIGQSYFQMCQKELSTELSMTDYYLALAKGTFQLSSYLHQKQTLLFPNSPIPVIRHLILKFAYLFHTFDLVQMQEILMQNAIRQHVTLIKEDPSNLAAHSSLANTHIALSKLYEMPGDLKFMHRSFTTKRFYKLETMRRRFEFATKEAIEELTILDNLAPNDPWVHAKLASCYNLLSMKDKELLEYETLRTLRPEDKDILFRLGSLYFEMGQKAKGLQVYDVLKQVDALSSKELIDKYDIYSHLS